jgi:cytochrome c553
MSRPKVLKVLAYSAGSLVAFLVVATGAVYGISHYRIHRTHNVTVPPIVVPTDAASIERGRHFVTTRACADCHGADFGGHKVIDDPMAGLFYAANITHGVGGLPADYSDLDYVRAIRHGLARDGRGLALMPSQEYTNLSDEDLGSVIAYLKTLPPVDRPRGPIAPGPIIRLLVALGKVKLAAETIDHTATRVASVTPMISADYGKYLATTCTGCHGPNMSGGKIEGGPPDWPAAANLTAASALANWTETQFMQTLRTRKRPDGTELNPVMPAAIGQLSDLELKALWAYLKTLPATPTGMR